MIDDLEWYLLAADLPGTVQAVNTIKAFIHKLGLHHDREAIQDRLETEMDSLEATAEGDFDWSDRLLDHVKQNSAMYPHIEAAQ